MKGSVSSRVSSSGEEDSVLRIREASEDAKWAEGSALSTKNLRHSTCQRMGLIRIYHHRSAVDCRYV